MDIAGIRGSDGLALIEIDEFSAQVAWLHESIAPGKSPKEMKQWLSDFYTNQTLTQDEMDSLIERAMSHPKLVPKDFLFVLSVFVQPLWAIIDNIDSE
jgi:hypothetical protein